MYEITNSDWKKYREKIGIWQEKGMFTQQFEEQELNHLLAAINS